MEDQALFLKLIFVLQDTMQCYDLVTLGLNTCFKNSVFITEIFFY